MTQLSGATHCKPEKEGANDMGRAASDHFAPPSDVVTANAPFALFTNDPPSLLSDTTAVHLYTDTHVSESTNVFAAYGAGPAAMDHF
jgi:hypothetical protein